MVKVSDVQKSKHCVSSNAPSFPRCDVASQDKYACHFSHYCNFQLARGTGRKKVQNKKVASFLSIFIPSHIQEEGKSKRWRGLLLSGVTRWNNKWSTPKHQPKHEFEKWFNSLIGVFWTYGRTYVWTDGRTPSLEIMNHFSSLYFGLCLGVD